MFLLAVRCPYCGSRFAVKRITAGSADDDLPSIEDGEKVSPGKRDYGTFHCGDCGRTFEAGGLTWFEERRWRS
jgi:transcription elongation factor Elf1